MFFTIVIIFGCITIGLIMFSLISDLDRAYFLDKHQLILDQLGPSQGVVSVIIYELSASFKRADKIALIIASMFTTLLFPFRIPIMTTIGALNTNSIYDFINIILLVSSIAIYIYSLTITIFQKLINRVKYDMTISMNIIENIEGSLNSISEIEGIKYSKFLIYKFNQYTKQDNSKFLASAMYDVSREASQVLLGKMLATFIISSLVLISAITAIYLVGFIGVLVLYPVLIILGEIYRHNNMRVMKTKSIDELFIAGNKSLYLPFFKYLLWWVGINTCLLIPLKMLGILS